MSQKQLEANRKNALLGGVKTASGKAASRMNAMKHGIMCKVILLPDENKNELLSLEKSMRNELKPVGELEIALVDRIVSSLWRLKRALKAEKEMMISDCGLDNISVGKNERTLGTAMASDFADYDTYGKFIKYEASIERGFYKALHELQRIQAVRSGKNVAVPVALDIDIQKE